MKVIVIDDEEMKTLCDDLNEYKPFGPGNVMKFGYDVSIVKEYLSQKGDDIDVAIIDQFIGEFRGTDLGAWINIHFPHIVCILLTGGGPDKTTSNQNLLQICMDSMEKGFTAFMLKGNECTDKKILFSSFDRILGLPSMVGKQKSKQDKLLGTTLEANLLSKYQESDTFSTEFCLHAIELIAQAHFISHKQYPIDALFYSRCFKRIEKELQYVNLKDSEPPKFSFKLLGNRHARKRYGEKMEIIRKYFSEFKVDDFNERAKILGSSTSNVNILSVHFNKNRIQEITYRLLKTRPDEWQLAREYFPPVKKVVVKYNLTSLSKTQAN